MVASNVVNLRPVSARPYDHEVEEGTPVVLSDLEWSVVVEILGKSHALAGEQLADSIRAQVRAHQSRRLHPSSRGSG